MHRFSGTLSGIESMGACHVAYEARRACPNVCYATQQSASACSARDKRHQCPRDAHAHTLTPCYFYTVSANKRALRGHRACVQPAALILAPAVASPAWQRWSRPVHGCKNGHQHARRVYRRRPPPLSPSARGTHRHCLNLSARQHTSRSVARASASVSV
jgi:hypothetical protein